MLAFLFKNPIIVGMSDAKPHPSRMSMCWKWASVGVLIGLVLLWIFLTPPGVLGKADAVGYALCHRIEIRSYQIGTRQFPLCVRCTGQFLGALLALIYQFFSGRRCMGKPGWGVLAVLGSLFLFYLVDGLNSYLHLTPMMQALPNLPRLYEPSNLLRLLTGTGIGLVIAAAVYPSFNSTVWCNPDPRPALRTASLAGLLVSALILDGLILLQIPWVMLVLAVLSAVAALTLLAMVYTIIVVILLQQENRFERMSQLVLPLLGGLGIAFLQIAIVDLLRYWLTGTWDGFHLG